MSRTSNESGHHLLLFTSSANHFGCMAFVREYSNLRLLLGLTRFITWCSKQQNCNCRSCRTCLDASQHRLACDRLWASAGSINLSTSGLSVSDEEFCERSLKRRSRLLGSRLRCNVAHSLCIRYRCLHTINHFVRNNILRLSWMWTAFKGLTKKFTKLIGDGRERRCRVWEGFTQSFKAQRKIIPQNVLALYLALPYQSQIIFHRDEPQNKTRYSNLSSNTIYEYRVLAIFPRNFDSNKSLQMASVAYRYLRIRI